MPIFEKRYPKNDAVRKCIEGCEAFSRGEITIEDLRKLRAYAAAAAAAAARKTTQLQCANIVRQHLPTLP